MKYVEVVRSEWFDETIYDEFGIKRGWKRYKKQIPWKRLGLQPLYVSGKAQAWRARTGRIGWVLFRTETGELEWRKVVTKNAGKGEDFYIVELYPYDEVVDALQSIGW